MDHAKEPMLPTMESKINAEGRVVVPAAIRRLLGVRAGDRLLFVPDGLGGVRLTSPQALIREVWANNHGPEGGESGADVRAMRDEDQERELERLNETSAQDALDTRSDAEVASALFASLGLRE
jgi:AbrB family looped-hinge helix DNA binding protein